MRQLLDIDVEVVAPGPLPKADLTLLSLPTGGHADLAEEALGHGSHVISISESPKDVEELLALEAMAVKEDRSVIVGAAFSPGLSCLLARHAASILIVSMKCILLEWAQVSRVSTPTPLRSNSRCCGIERKSLDQKTQQYRPRIGLVSRPSRRTRLLQGRPIGPGSTRRNFPHS